LGVMLRRITAATLILLAACGTTRIGWPAIGGIGGGETLSYAQYKSLAKGMRARSILDAFGTPADTLERDGLIRGLTYRCEDGTGEVRQLRMVFTIEERLEEWALKLANGSVPAEPEADEPDRGKSP